MTPVPDLADTTPTDAATSGPRSALMTTPPPHLRRRWLSPGPRRHPLVEVGLLLAVAGVVVATSYVTNASGNLNGTVSIQPGGDCGFVSLPGSTDVVGTGSQSGPNYITFAPTLSSTTVTQTVVATVDQFGTGNPGGYEYLVDEVAFGCNEVAAGASLVLSFSATSSTSNVNWVVMQVSYSPNTPSTNPTFGAPCDQSGGDLYLPFGAVASTFVAGNSSYVGGNTYTFTANQTGGLHLTRDSCTANAHAGQTGPPAIQVASNQASLVLYYYISFAFVDASSTSSIINPAFTMSFV